MPGNHHLKLTVDHLEVAKWNVDQAKKAIAAVGQAKTKRPTVKAAPVSSHPPWFGAEVDVFVLLRSRDH